MSVIVPTQSKALMLTAFMTLPTFHLCQTRCSHRLPSGRVPEAACLTLGSCHMQAGFYLESSADCTCNVVQTILFLGRFGGLQKS